MKGKLFLTGLLVISIGAGFSVLFYNQKEQETERLRSLEAQIQRISAERIIIAKKLKETKDKKEFLQGELEGYNRKVQLLQKEILDIKEKGSELTRRLSQKEGAISELEGRLTAVVNEESELNEALGRTRLDYQARVGKIEAAAKEKLELEEEIKTRLSAARGVELKKIVVRVTPPLEGEILEVNKEHNFAIIDLGLKDNLKSGDLFCIYRKDRLIAKAVAENIYKDMSSIIVLDEWQDLPLLNGDTVKLLK